MSEYKLTQEIIRRSTAPTWAQAKLEWELADVYWQSETETRLCGHYPINEVCVIRNKLNGRSVEVGNVCVKKFLGLSSDRIFKALRRIRTDDARSLSKEAIEHAHAKGWISGEGIQSRYGSETQAFAQAASEA